MAVEQAIRFLARLRLGKYLGHSPLTSLVDGIYPPFCPVCDRILSNGQNIAALCYQCWDKLDFSDGAICHRCALPIEYDSPILAGEVLTCFDCIRKPPKFDSARSVFFYNGIIKSILMQFKYADRTDLRHMLAAWLESLIGDWLEECDYVIPVPLNYWRTIGRRYNQSLIITRAMRHPAQKEKLVPDMLVRHRYTKTMKNMSTRQRADNMRGSMLLNPKWKGKLDGKTVLVIDDVLTSGATFDVCARTLKANGVKKVYVASLARVGAN